MADAVWPISLPTAPLLRGLSEKRPDLTARFATDVGPAKVRGRGTVGVTTFPCQMLLTGTLVAVFDAFFYTTLAGGALEFEWTHPRLGTTVEFRFVGPPEYTPRAPRQAGAERYEVKFTLELIPSADAIVVDGGGDIPPEGGAFFSLPPEWPDSAPEDGGFTADWGDAGVVEDPPAPAEGLLWQIGVEDQNPDWGGDDDSGVGGALSGDGGGSGTPIAGTGSASGSGDGSAGSGHTGGAISSA